MFLEFKEYNENSNSGIAPLICFGCENICFLACTSCDGCLGATNIIRKSANQQQS